MTDPNPSRRRRMPYPGRLCRVNLLAVCCASLSLAQAADDAYLRQLDQEVSKVGGVVTDNQGNGAGGSTTAVGDAAAQGAVSRQTFEALLKGKHVGTYSFYRRLPERSREEIFVDYRRGASLEALREKIIDRYLHP